MARALAAAILLLTAWGTPCAGQALEGGPVPVFEAPLAGPSLEPAGPWGWTRSDPVADVPGVEPVLADRDTILRTAFGGALIGCAIGVFMGPEQGAAFGCGVGALVGGGLGALLGSGL